MNLPERIRIFLTETAPVDGSLSILDQAVCSATTFLTGVLIANTAGTSELGYYTLILSIIMLGGELQNSLIIIPYTVLYPQTAGRDRPDFLNNAVLQQFILIFFLLAFIALGHAGLPFTCGSLNIHYILVSLAVALPGMMIRQFARLVSFSHLRLWTTLILDASTGILQIGGLCGLMYFGRLGSAFHAFCVIGAACTLSGVFWILRQDVFVRLHWMHAFRTIQDNWKYSKWLVNTIPVAYLRGQLGIWMLTIFYDSYHTGLFSACFAITSIGNMFVLGLGNFIGSMSCHKYDKNDVVPMLKFIIYITIFIGVFTGAFCGIMVIWGSTIVSFVYGSEYSGLGMAISVLAVSSFVWSLSTPTYRGLIAINQSQVIMMTELLILCVNIVLGYWLILVHGVSGAAWTVMAGNSVGSVFQISLFFKHIQHCKKNSCVAHPA